jgi:hypothetical protein
VRALLSWPFGGDKGEKKAGKFDDILKTARTMRRGTELAPAEAPEGLKLATFAGAARFAPCPPPCWAAASLLMLAGTPPHQHRQLPPPNPHLSELLAWLPQAAASGASRWAVVSGRPSAISRA